MSRNDDEEAAIRAAQEQFWRAGNVGDRTALEELLDEDFVYVEADSLDRKGKSDFINEVADRAQEQEILAFELVNVEVRQTAEMAVVVAQFHIDQEDDDERYRSSGNAVEVLVRRAGGWKVVSSVFGEVPPFVE